MAADSTADATPDESRRFSIPLPSPPWILLAGVVLVAGYMTCSCWFAYVANQRSIRHFLQCARVGDFGHCRGMLSDDHGAEWLLLDKALRDAADRPLRTESPSFLDLLRGGQRFNGHGGLYANDDSITVQRGRVTLGSGFWLQYLPPGPEFKMVRQVEASSNDSVNSVNASNEKAEVDRR